MASEILAKAARSWYGPLLDSLPRSFAARCAASTAASASLGACTASPRSTGADHTGTYLGLFLIRCAFCRHAAEQYFELLRLGV